MSLTIEKLQRCLKELQRAMYEDALILAPIFTVPAPAPMASPPDSTNQAWQRLLLGELWGAHHSTTWLRTCLQLAHFANSHEQEYVLSLAWDTREDDHLLLQLEATIFLDGQSIGAIDWRHPRLVLPIKVYDDRQHILMLQIYTRAPLPFDGLIVQKRDSLLWRLYHHMHSILEGLLTLNENELVRHVLLEQLNTAYNMLDVREGWRATLLKDSAHVALAFLQNALNSDLVSGSRPSITVSGHAHLDVGWRWPYWRTRQKIAHTISNVLALMERYPDYYYSQSQPQLLQWLKEDQPELYARVKERVTEGRIELVGAMWIEADCNLPSGESFIRQILHGIRFTRQEFGRTPGLIWLPDVFGYSAALPQIMRGCDIPIFMTTKISWNQFNRMPNDTFRWRGIDGSEVLTHFITAPDEHENATYYTYNGPLNAADLVKTWTNYRQQAINDQLLYLCGWGDGGGGPTEEQLERMQIMEHLRGTFPKIHMGRTDAYFASLYERVWGNQRLPVWVGELYLEYHRGTYTSQARIKQANRRIEFWYHEVEFLNAWSCIYGMPSRQEQLNAGWHNILLNQFHDVLPGSSIREVYEDAERLYSEAYALGVQIHDEAVAVLRSSFKFEEQEHLLLNPLPWERDDPIQLLPGTLPFVLEQAETQRAVDWDGKSFLLLDGVRVPSYSLSSLSSRRTRRENTPSACHVNKTAEGEHLLQNAYYELMLDTHGEIRRLYDKRAGRDILQQGQTANQLIVYEDRPLHYDAWDIDLYYEEKPYPLREATVRVIEHGPVRIAVEVTRHFLSSRITQHIALWCTSPRIDFATEIDWHEHQLVLKAAFPVAINSTRATYEIQFGHVERPTHRNTSWDVARFEVCAHRWVDLSEGGYGVSLLNDGKYGHDIHDNVVRLTLLKSGIDPDPNADQGLHRFTYSLLPHPGDWRTGETVRRAYELNVPIQVMYGKSSSAHITEKKALRSEISFLSTNCPHVVVETIKPAEDGNGVIVRLYEAHNQHGSGALFFASPIMTAEECNLLEEPKDRASYDQYTLWFEVRPFEIKTFRVHFT